MADYTILFLVSAVIAMICFAIAGSLTDDDDNASWFFLVFVVGLAAMGLLALGLYQGGKGHPAGDTFPNGLAEGGVYHTEESVKVGGTLYVFIRRMDCDASSYSCGPEVFSFNEKPPEYFVRTEGRAYNKVSKEDAQAAYNDAQK